MRMLAIHCINGDSFVLLLHYFCCGGMFVCKNVCNNNNGVMNVELKAFYGLLSAWMYVNRYVPAIAA